MALCPNVYEVKIILHDHRLTHSFNRFLRSLWKAEYVGMRLQSLSIETTLAKVPRFLQPLVNFSDALKKLEEFNFDISPTRDKHDQEAVDLAVTSLRSFLVAFNGQLTTIGLSSPLFGEMDIFLGTALQFARLKKLEIFAFFGEDPKQFERLSHFIIGHAVTLKHLTIKPQPRYYIGKTSSLEYTNWINPGDSGTDAFASSLHSLESLHLGLCGGPEEDGIWIPENLLNSRVLPSLSTFAPCITSLILTGLPLSLGHISDLIDGLSVDSNGRRLLRSLRVSLLAANTLSSSLFDILASKLNGLKSLAVIIVGCICQEMQEKNYHEWRLEVLRLTTIHSCPSPHPNLRIMEAVAERFQFPPNIDCSYTCSCFLHEE
ncbi:hypothetical protein CPB84DRAFT_1769299 [Gymnopilus junonius]|uniref:Uncharacterized protein n=1 Tax=Gymnopilus junonius TaxID=109634 RepID=A0A9P5NXC2_GYMJU|nr:hypothetical protein CPB84DRAFT_1769299 [Gymnopilus junonius]